MFYADVPRSPLLGQIREIFIGIVLDSQLTVLRIAE